MLTSRSDRAVLHGLGLACWVWLLLWVGSSYAQTPGEPESSQPVVTRNTKEADSSRSESDDIVPAPALPISHIVIQNHGVFDPSIPRYRRFPYPLLNHLHIKTRPGVIRRELLFAEGQPYDRELIRESERNLRRLAFFNRVQVIPVRSDTTTGVVVQTEDQWTMTPDIVIDRRGGINRFGLGIEDANFLGLGKAMNLRFLTTSDRTLGRVIYTDPRLLGSRWRLETIGISSSDGALYKAQSSLPRSDWGLPSSRMWAVSGDRMNG